MEVEDLYRKIERLEAEKNAYREELEEREQREEELEAVPMRKPTAQCFCFGWT